MKNNTTTLHDERELNNSAGGCKAATGHQVWKLGLDVDLRQVVVGIECERGGIGPADLWRWRTGRATAAELGWTVTSATSPMLSTNH